VQGKCDEPSYRQAFLHYLVELGGVAIVHQHRRMFNGCWATYVNGCGEAEEVCSARSDDRYKTVPIEIVRE